jgi:hypothetical protein
VCASGRGGHPVSLTDHGVSEKPPRLAGKRLRDHPQSRPWWHALPFTFMMRNGYSVENVPGRAATTGAARTHYLFIKSSDIFNRIRTLKLKFRVCARELPHAQVESAHLQGLSCRNRLRRSATLPLRDTLWWWCRHGHVSRRGDADCVLQ